VAGLKKRIHAEGGKRVYVPVLPEVISIAKAALSRGCLSPKRDVVSRAFHNLIITSP